MTNKPQNGQVSDIRLESTTLVAHNSDALHRFYIEGLGLSLQNKDGDMTVLGAGKNSEILRILHAPSAAARSGDAPGLFHTAYLYPGRRELAAAVRQLLRYGWPLQGAADHGVSEALYLHDPEGNGIELYADRPRDQWPYKDGELAMVTEALDADSLLAEPEPDDDSIVRIGHLHLQVSSLPDAEAFWCEHIGLDIVQRSFPGALFVSAGGYHHHVGLNTWRSAGKKLPEGEWTGLKEIRLSIPDREEFEKIGERFRKGPTEPQGSITSEHEGTSISISHHTKEKDTS